LRADGFFISVSSSDVGAIMIRYLLFSLSPVALWANLQIDVPIDIFPENPVLDEIGATMVLAENPVSYPLSMLSGPDGFPLMYHLIFAYDEELTGGVVEEILLEYGNCSSSWIPDPFTVFYGQGPMFPFDGLFDPFSADCIDVDLGSLEIPASMTILGASPNPFNPSTRIDFHLARADQVALLVFDLAGHQLLHIPAKPYAPGQHSIELDAADWASGIYIYQLRSSTSIAVCGNMTLIR
jgi:hypothetical protein